VSTRSDLGSRTLPAGILLAVPGFVFRLIGPRATFPSGPYGIGIIVALGMAEAESVRDNDPAVRSTHGFRSEIAPMLRLVTADGTHDMLPASDAT